MLHAQPIMFQWTAMSTPHHKAEWQNMKVFLVYDMKIYGGGMEEQIQSFSTAVLDGGERSGSRTGRFKPDKAASPTTA